MNLKMWGLISNESRGITSHPGPPYEPQTFIIDDRRDLTPHPGSLPVEGRGRIIRRFLAMLRDSIRFQGSMRELRFGEISFR
jgi:hypothetical protein